jgi:hypothetical protein
VLLAALLECETSGGDALVAVELLAEARASALPLPADAGAAGARIFARAGQWKRALALVSGAGAAGAVPDVRTLAAVFRALAVAQQVEPARALQAELVAAGAGEAQLTAAACGVLRAVARSGDVLAACDMLDALIKQRVDVDVDTYTAVAMELVKAGEDERAAEVLDLRDYM